ncbi:ankyrin repeat domain-containing protein [Mucilaginibacter mali]|uniref:Ankyrin repeat domain-containing protein n=1 Tax=Mucilaginibacter mali TaxID=2740462 RepID=A0A7D4UKM0_9SPHI|nr:ankyrin repeat domain-containing protein [Mucilaginibacter mali]QKJ30822.1 ankyrin repeat domain-containing protein [Mucilaginibacter mali]
MMIRPNDLKQELPKEVGNGEISTTTKVWEILSASYEGNLSRVKELVNKCPGLIYAQYNYAPPIHFAVREGHTEMVKYLLDNGAHDPSYRFYPFLDSLQTVADDRGYSHIVQLLDEYENTPAKHRFKGDNGRVFYNRTTLQNEFEQAVDKNNLNRTAAILKQHPEFALDESYFWGEGILTMPAKRNHREMIDLLMSHGAKVPDILKWTQFYYFERYDAASYIMAKGMNPNTMSWQHVSILHDMAQKGFIDKAELLISHGADLDLIDEAYLSTPLGLAARWGQTEMVQYLIEHGADIRKAGAIWATPLNWAKKKGHEEIVALLEKSIQN